MHQIRKDDNTQIFDIYNINDLQFLKLHNVGNTKNNLRRINNILNFSCLNINSLSKHYDILNNFLINSNCSLFFLVETCLTPDIPSNPFHINGFSFIRNDRAILKENNKYYRGGGVAFYIHNSIHFKVLEESKNASIQAIEFIFFEIQLNYYLSET